MLLALAAAALASPGSARAADRWWKTDTHVHSVVSGDGLPDLGIISTAAKARGYNAMFITDHQAGSNFPISTVIANHVEFDDDLGSKWLSDFFATPTVKAAELVDTPVHTGAKSLHVKASATTSGESFVRIKRGPNLRSGDLILRFSAFPTRLDAASGMYVSAALGGDVTEGTLDGYTTRSGAVSPGKSTVLVWQLGSARSASADPNARVIVNSLPFTLGVWNDYEINMTTGAVKRNGVQVKAGGGGIAGIPSADQPLDYNSLVVMKMAAAAANGGTAEGYFDTYNLDASAPVPSGEEFLYRNSGLRGFDTADFKLFPSIEMGYNRHAQRFNFDIAGSSEYNDFFQCDTFGDRCRITRGVDGIAPTQQTGYPAQLNHPNLPGGVKADEMVADGYNAFGADMMEVRDDPSGAPPTMIDLWDEVLKRGRMLIGTWSSDMHKVESLDVADRGVATYIRSPSLDFDKLMRGMFEGRAYLGQRTFAGQVAFNLDPASQEPYPSRYPVQVSDGRSSANVHLAISGGIPAGAKVAWIVNGSVFALDSPTGASYEATKAIPLTGAWSYVRAELRPASGTLLAATEPIAFSDVAGLPADARLGVDGVDTATGRGYTKLLTKGITASSWNAAARSLSVTLDEPQSAITRLSMDTGATLVPESLHLEGVRVAQATTQSAFDAAAGSAWFYDASAHRLLVKALQPASAAGLLVQFQGPPDTEPPAAPPALTATATSPTAIALAWGASSDNRGVAGYRVLRGPCGSGTAVATVGGGTTKYADAGLAPGTTASYQVQAFDAAGNVSGRSPCATASTPTTDTATFAAAGDSYVAADQPAAKNGALTKLRADASPDTRSYVRFDLSGLQGTVTKATLVLSSTSASNTGFDVRRVADTTWDERFITYSNAPPVATGPALGSSLPFATGATPSVDVTSAVTGNGGVAFALTTTTTTAFSLASREAGATGPRLIVETKLDAPPPPPPPPPATTTFTPAADSFVGADAPTALNGANAKLRADASPDIRSYVRFDVAGLQGSVKKATLVLTATSASSAGFDVRGVADTTWGESTITYANAPPVTAGLPLGSSLPFATGGTPSVDVTAAVTGNGPVGFALTTPSTTALSLASREAGTTGPRLVIDSG